jgi:hypothetical protein
MRSHEAAISGGLWALLYSFTICFVGTVLFLTVDKFEPDRRYANVLKLLILALGAAAIARQLLP